MLSKLKIRAKLLLIFLSISIVSISVTGWLGYKNAEKSLEKAYFEQLTAIRETKKRQIETYFRHVRNQIITLSENQMIVDAMNQFKKAFFIDFKRGGIKDVESKIQEYTSSVKDYYQNEYLARLNPNIKNKGTFEQYWPGEDDEPYHNSVFLQYYYISNNPYPTGSKDNLEMADDGSEYSRIHSKYHPIIRNYLKKFGYYDIFLIDVETGHIVYSVFKEVDFSTNLLTGPYRDTNFASAFREALDATEKEFVKLIDFEPYDPSYADPAAFIVSPIFDNNKKIGVLVFQVPIDEINRVMTGNFNWENEGLGKTGETYIVGADYKMRNDSRFIIEDPKRYFSLLKQIGTVMEVINLIKSHSTSILFQRVYTEGVENALKGNSDTKITDNYKGISVLSSYTPLNIEDVYWVMLSEIDKEEAFSSLYILRNKILLTMVIILIFVIFLVFLFSRAISKPILLLANTMKDVRKGNLSKRVNITHKDEIGMLASSFNSMAESLLQSRNMLELRVKKRTSELEKANEEIKKFAYIVSHDLRAPLVNIKGFSAELRSALKVIDLAYNTVLPHLNKEQREEIDMAIHVDVPEALEYIESSTTRMGRLINAVLKLSRLGRRELDFENVDMNNLVDTIISTLFYQIDKKHVKVVINPLPKVIADQTAMQQIMGNILQNAVNYLDPDRQGEIEITGEDGENETTFSIRDNGIGIANDEINKIFDVFYRAGKHELPGEGMGLAYVKVLVQNHGGKIWCKSIPGEGTTFTFTISRDFLKGEKDV